jgi:hypothetical protein
MKSASLHGNCGRLEVAFHAALIEACKIHGPSLSTCSGLVLLRKERLGDLETCSAFGLTFLELCLRSHLPCKRRREDCRLPFTALPQSTLASNRHRSPLIISNPGEKSKLNQSLSSIIDEKIKCLVRKVGFTRLTRLLAFLSPSEIFPNLLSNFTTLSQLRLLQGNLILLSQ